MYVFFNNFHAFSFNIHRLRCNGRLIQWNVSLPLHFGRYCVDWFRGLGVLAGRWSSHIWRWWRAIIWYCFVAVLVTVGGVGIGVWWATGSRIYEKWNWKKNDWKVYIIMLDGQWRESYVYYIVPFHLKQFIGHWTKKVAVYQNLRYYLFSYFF